MNDRIKLAEAMGFLMGDSYKELNFDPFADANDDYAVLEWMRNHEHPEWFVDELRGGDKSLSPWHYFIGDYARAAVLVLGSHK